MNWVNNVLSILFPIKCIGCKKENEYICEKCLSSIEISNPHKENWIHTSISYKNPLVRRILHLYKFKGRKALAHTFAKILNEKILDVFEDDFLLSKEEKIILVPIPLSKARSRFRGYNQSLLLAKELKKLNPNLFEIENEAIIKTKETERQALIHNRNKRLKNLVDCFHLKNGEKIKGSVVIILDDITTTGATFIEAKKVINKAKPRKVYAFAISH